MGLRDKLRALTGAAASDGAAGPAGDTGAAADEVTEFTPRQNGEYQCEGRPQYLRFTGPTVAETTDGTQEPTTGDFTLTGRFSVQRQFERPVVFTVLSQDAEAGTFVARRTDTNTRATEELTYTFREDEA